MDVEFLPEDGPPVAPEPLPARRRRGRPVMVALAGVAVVGAVVIAGHHGSGHPSALATTTTSPRTVVPSVPRATCRDISCGSHPSGVIEAMVAQHLPGATVIDENSQILRPDGLLGTASLGARTLEVVYRGTVITVHVQSDPGGPPSPTHFVQAGYGIDVTSSGPLRVDPQSLRALAADPRLTTP